MMLRRVDVYSQLRRRDDDDNDEEEEEEDDGGERLHVGEK